MIAFIICLTLSLMVGGKGSLIISKGDGQRIYPEDSVAAKETTKCGITYRKKFKQSQILLVSDEEQFGVTVTSNSLNIHITGYAVSRREQNRHIAQLLIYKECTYHKDSSNIQIDYQMIFKIYKGNKVQTETIKAVSDCSENGEDIENLRSTMSLMYALIWVISLSFLPVFPDSHSLPLTLTIVFYITISLAFQIHPFILLPIMLIVFRLSLKSYEIGRNYDLIQQAMISERAFLSLLVFYCMLMTINFISFTMYGDNYFYNVGIFLNISIHVFNFTKLLIHGFLFCKLIWLNRFRDLCLWLIVVCIVHNLFDFLQEDTYVSFFSFLNPGLFSNVCSYRNVGFILMMMPVALYIKRLDRNWQFMSSLLLIVCLVTMNFSLNFLIPIGVVLIWAFLQSLRIGFIEFIRFRWMDGNIRDQY